MIGYWRFSDAILALYTQCLHAILPGLIPPWDKEDSGPIVIYC